MKKLGLILLLSYVGGIGPKKMEQILGEVSSIEELKSEYKRIFQKVGINEKITNNYLKIMNNFCLEETILKYKDKGIHIITKEDTFYPSLLKEIYDPPQVLFCKGDLSILKNEKNISIVGARKATWYGKNVAKEIGQKLSEEGFTVTSGMALGIDAYAHLGALEGSGGTIGVLGCGIDEVYPKQNQKLYQMVEEKGLLLSAYPLGTQPYAGNFPARNRIISGLSKGVVVVEAQLKSGALITVDFATEQGRDIFAVPGNINSTMSSGSNNLIKDGAIMVTKYQDVLAEYGLSYEDSSNIYMELTDMEKKIFKEINGQIFTLEHLLLITGLDISEILVNLMTLEIKGLIKKIGNQMYQPVKKVDF